MTDTAAGRSGSFDIGRVINQTVSALTARFTASMGAYVGLVFIVTALSRVVGTSYTARFAGALARSGVVAPKLPAGLLMVAVPVILALSVVLVIVRSAVIREVVGRLIGAPVTSSEAFRVGVNRFWPVLGIGILGGLAIVVATMFLIVPGIIVVVMICVYYPVAVMERRGAGSLSRSAELTKGHRWPIFGLMMIFLVVAIVASIVGSVAAMIAGPTSLIGAVITAIFQTGTALVGVTGVSALYVELRNGKDGFASQTADVFA